MSETLRSAQGGITFHCELITRNVVLSGAKNVTDHARGPSLRSGDITFHCELITRNVVLSGAENPTGHVRGPSLTLRTTSLYDSTILISSWFKPYKS